MSEPILIIDLTDDRAAMHDLGWPISMRKLAANGLSLSSEMVGAPSESEIEEISQPGASDTSKLLLDLSVDGPPTFVAGAWNAAWLKCARPSIRLASVHGCDTRRTEAISRASIGDEPLAVRCEAVSFEDELGNVGSSAVQSGQIVRHNRLYRLAIESISTRVFGFGHRSAENGQNRFPFWATGVTKLLNQLVISHRLEWHKACTQCFKELTWATESTWRRSNANSDTDRR